MATVSCTFGGRTSYNNGWTWKYFYSAAGYGHHGFGKDKYGRYRCIVLKITTPTLQSTYINRKLSINIPMCKSSAAGYDTFNYRVTTTAPTFSEGGAEDVAFPSSYIHGGTLSVYNGNNSSGYVMRTLTINAANIASGTTYYIWLWSDTPASGYSGYYAHHSSYGGLISVAVAYDLQQKSTLAANNGTLGTAQKLTVTQQDASTKHTITYKCGDASGTICTKSSSTSISWTPPLSLASQNTTGTTVPVTLTITTYSGDTNLGSNTKSITCAIPASVKPSCTVAVTETTDYATKYGAYILGQSVAKIVVIPTIAYDSPISRYLVEADGYQYNKSSFSILVSRNYGTGTLDITAKVTDERSRVSDVASASIEVLEYYAPVITKLSVHRCDENGTEDHQGEYVHVTFSGIVHDLNSKNSVKYTLKYKKSTDTEYASVVLLDSSDGSTPEYDAQDISYTFAADSGSSYNVELVLEDDFGSVSRATSASTASVIMHWRASGNGMAIGKIAELDDHLEVGYQTLLHKHLYLKTGANLYLESPDGAMRNMMYLGTDNNFIVGYDGYSAEAGATKLYGNTIDILHNGGISINGSTFSDFVVERGTSGIWTYERRASGIVRCWGRIPITDLAISTAMGSLYRSSRAYTVADYPYPIKFREIPVTQLSFSTTNGIGGLAWKSDESSITNPPACYIVRQNSATGANGYVDITVDGIWFKASSGSTNTPLA